MPLAERESWRFAGPLVRRMSAEQAWDSLLILTEGARVDESLLRRGDALRPFSLPGKEVTEAVVRDMMQRADPDEAVLAAKAGAGKKKRADARVNPRLLDAAYEGRTPDQRGGMVLARASELPQPAPEAHFLRLFGQSDRLVADSSTTDGSVPQALALMNGPAQSMVTVSSSAVMKDVMTAPEGERIERLHLHFLARRPTAEEQARAEAALAKGVSLEDLAWVLLNSREFLFVK